MYLSDLIQRESVARAAKGYFRPSIHDIISVGGKPQNTIYVNDDCDDGFLLQSDLYVH